MRLRDAWDAQADEWARFVRDPAGDRTNARFNLPALLELVPPPGRRTLDLACGEGRLLAALGERGHRAVGVDASPRMVAYARERGEAVVADAAALPFADAAFDLVISFMSLHDIDDMPAAVGEVGRVLEPAGRFCFAVLHPIATAGRFDPGDADAPFAIEGLYLAERRHDQVIDRDGHRITLAQIHRPLEAYARALEAAELRIEAIREPRPPDDYARDFPSVGKWRRLPLFLHVRAVKA